MSGYISELYTQVDKLSPICSVNEVMVMTKKYTMLNVYLFAEDLSAL